LEKEKMFDLLLSHIRSQGLPLEMNFSNLSLTYSSYLLLIAIPFISKKYIKYFIAI